MKKYAPEIILECSLNARDLGGIPAAEGSRVKSGRLIRSGELSRLSPSDESYLRGIGLRSIVDFRTEQERILKADRQISGVNYLHLPVIESLLPGITRESIEDPYKAFSRPTLKLSERRAILKIFSQVLNPFFKEIVSFTIFSINFFI